MSLQKILGNLGFHQTDKTDEIRMKLEAGEIGDLATYKLADVAKVGAEYISGEVESGHFMAALKVKNHLEKQGVKVEVPEEVAKKGLDSARYLLSDERLDDGKSYCDQLAVRLTETSETGIGSFVDYFADQRVTDYIASSSKADGLTDALRLWQGLTEDAYHPSVVRKRRIPPLKFILESRGIFDEGFMGVVQEVCSESLYGHFERTMADTREQEAPKMGYQTIGEARLLLSRVTGDNGSIQDLLSITKSIPTSYGHNGLKPLDFDNSYFDKK